LHPYSKEPANRTRFYKAELRFKALGIYRRGAEQAPPAAPPGGVDPVPRLHSEASTLSGLGGNSTSMFWGSPGGSGYGSDGGTGYGSDGNSYGGDGGGDGGSDGGGGGGGEEMEQQGVRAVRTSRASTSHSPRRGSVHSSNPCAAGLDTPGDRPYPHREMSGDLMQWMAAEFPLAQHKSGWQRLTVPADPFNLPKRRFSASGLLAQEAGGGGGGGGGGLTSEASSSSAGVGVGGSLTCSGGSGLLPHIAEAAGAGGAGAGGTGAGAGERNTNTKLSRSMCQPVNRIWRGLRDRSESRTPHTTSFTASHMNPSLPGSDDVTRRGARRAAGPTPRGAVPGSGRGVPGTGGLRHGHLRWGYGPKP